MHGTRSPRAWGPSMGNVELSLSFREKKNVKRGLGPVDRERMCGCSGMPAWLCALLKRCSACSCLIDSSSKVVKN